MTDANYKGLVALQQRYEADGFTVLAFPCNQFGGQEPGSKQEILDFTAKYGVTFPIFEKVRPQTLIASQLLLHRCMLLLLLLSAQRAAPFLSQVDVNGMNTHPLFKFLKAQKGEPGVVGFLGNDIKWNFGARKACRMIHNTSNSPHNDQSHGESHIGSHCLSCFRSQIPHRP